MCSSDLSTTDGTAKALDIYHPDLAALGITAVCRARIGQLEHDGKGGASVSVDWIEYRPPKPKKPSTPKGSAAGAKPPGSSGTPDAPDPNAEAKAELDRLTQEANAP